MADRIYVTEGYVVTEYVGYQADARAELGGEYIDVGYYEYDYFESPSARATLVCDASRFKLVSAALTSTATVSAVISHIEGADLQAFNTALLTASVSVTKEAASGLSVTATTAVAGNRLRFGVASLDSAFTQTASVQRNRFADSALSTSATFVCDADVILGGTLVEASGSWNTTSSLTVNTGVIRSATVELTSAFTQTTSILEISGLELFAFTDALLAAEVQRLRDNNIQALAAFDIATTNFRVRYASAEIDAAASLTAVNERTRNNAAALDAAFSFSADVTRTRQTSSDLSSTTSLTVSGENVVNVSATLSSAATVTATISHIEGADLQAFNTATLSVTADRIRATDVALSSAFTQTANAGKSVIGAAALQSNAFPNFSARRTANLVATAINSNFTLTATALRRRSGTVTLSSAVTLSVSALKIKRANAAIVSVSTASIIAEKYKIVSANVSSAVTLTSAPNVNIRPTIGFDASQTIYWSSYCKVNSASQVLINGNFVLSPAATAIIGTSTLQYTPGKVFGASYTRPAATTFPVPEVETYLTYYVYMMSRRGFGDGLYRLYTAKVQYRMAYDQILPFVEDDWSIENSGFVSGSTSYPLPITIFRNSAGQPGEFGFELHSLAIDQTFSTGYTLPGGTSRDSVFLGITAVENTISNVVITENNVVNTYAYVPKIASADLIPKFTSNVIGYRAKFSTSSISAVTNITANNIRVRFGSVAATSTTAVIVAPIKVVSASANLTGTFTQTTSAIKTARLSPELNSQFTQTANNTRRRAVPAALSSAFTQTANPFGTVGIVANIVSTATLTADFVRTRAVDISTESIFSEMAAVTRIANGPLFALDSRFSLTCDAVFRSGVTADLTTTATVDAIGSRFKLNEAVLISTASLTADITKFRPGSSNMLAQATVSATTRIDTVASAGLTSAFTQITDNLRVRYNTANLTLVATQTTTAIKTARPLISLQSRATLAGFGTNVVNFNIALTAFNTQVTVGSVFRIDPYYQLIIAQETRLLKVRPESRLISIRQETKGLRIKPESRVLDIEKETRTITIRGYIE